jgi:hypothetical protein
MKAVVFKAPYQLAVDDPTIEQIGPGVNRVRAGDRDSVPGNLA